VGGLVSEESGVFSPLKNPPVPPLLKEKVEEPKEGFDGVALTLSMLEEPFIKAPG